MKRRYRAAFSGLPQVTYRSASARAARVRPWRADQLSWARSNRKLSSSRGSASANCSRFARQAPSSCRRHISYINAAGSDLRYATCLFELHQSRQLAEGDNRRGVPTDRLPQLARRGA